jgi:hypothetical protein
MTLREEPRLRVFENRALRRIVGPKGDDVMGGWRKLHNEELHNLYTSPSIIRMVKSSKMKWAGHVARRGAKSYAYRILVGKPEGKRPLGRSRHKHNRPLWVAVQGLIRPTPYTRSRHRCVDSIKMDLKEI